MKVCVFGAGAVGGHIAARLLAAKADDVSVVARGAVLHAIRSRGFTLRSGGSEISAKAEKATDDPSTLAPQDLVIVALKAHAVPGAASAIARLLGPQGAAVFLLNGIPWWWPHGRRGESGPLRLLDPESALWTHVKPERALGCVVHSPNEMVEPAVVVHTGQNHLILGEPDGSSSARLKSAVQMLSGRYRSSHISRSAPRGSGETRAERVGQHACRTRPRRPGGARRVTRSWPRSRCA